MDSAVYLKTINVVKSTLLVVVPYWAALLRMLLQLTPLSKYSLVSYLKKLQ